MSNHSGYHSVKWEINNGCNLNCPYCCLAEKGQTTEMEIGLEKQFELMDKFYLLGVREIDFFGKEPLLTGRPFVLMHHAQVAYPEFNFSMITNGVNLEKYLDEINNSCLTSLTISYAGKDSPRKFELDFDVINKIKKKVEISFDVTNMNFAQVMEYYPLFEHVGVESVYIKPILPYTPQASKYAVSVEDYFSLVKEANERVQIYTCFDIPVAWAHGGAYARFKQDSRINSPFVDFDADTRCMAGLSHLYVDYMGNAYGCGTSMIKESDHFANLFCIEPDQDPIDYVRGCIPPPSLCGAHCMV